ncbi:MAG: AAA family ATPase [Chitinophagales bacterium]|nr:AAA family ATPase [Chitinophagales bacterium]
MSSGLTRALENLIENLIEKNHLEKPFYGPGKLPALKILSISNALKQLNLSNEEIVFSYDKRNNDIFEGFILSDKKLHYIINNKPIVVPIVDLKNLNLEDFNTIIEDETTRKAILNVFEKIGKGNFDISTKKSKDPLKEFTENQTETTVEIIIDEDFLAESKLMGDQLYAFHTQLKGDSAFMDNLQKTLTKSATLTNEFQPWHLIIQDIILIYQKLEKEPISVKQRFLLAYFFEKMQGNDMAEVLSLERINKMVQNEKFSASLEKVKAAKFLEVGGEFKDQLILPSLLSRTNHELLTAVGTQYNRIANFFAKADGKITDEETSELQKISDLCLNPRKKLENVKQTQVPENETLEDVLKELNELVGLNNIKKDINDLINFLKIQKLREKEGLKPSDRALHSVFIGPPGTGKTTIARLLGRIFKHLGYLSSGHLVETDRSGLVAGYVGQTALKVDEVVKSAMNGVLFIDEAYSLAKDEFGRDFGNEAIETLLKRMEDHRDDLAVIAAGYPDEMKVFIQSNPGLQSRFNRYFAFDHYTPAEMMAIFNLYAKKADFIVNEDAAEKLSFIFEGLYERRNPAFGNARVVRNLFEQIIASQANRLVSITPITRDLLMRIEEPDVPEVQASIKNLMVFDEEEKSKE